MVQAEVTPKMKDDDNFENENSQGRSGNAYNKGSSIKYTSSNSRKIDPCTLSEKCLHWLNPLLPVRTHHNFKKSKVFSPKKCGRPHL